MSKDKRDTFPKETIILTYVEKGKKWTAKRSGNKRVGTEQSELLALNTLIEKERASRL